MIFLQALAPLAPPERACPSIYSGAMGYAVVALLGVLLGATAALGAAFLLLQRLSDRDLLERRLRVLLGYRDALGVPSELARGTKGYIEAAELDQLVHNLEAVAKEFRLTSWMFPDRLRGAIARALLAFEEEARRARMRGEKPSPVRITDAYRQLEITLRHAAHRGVDEFRRWRFWSFRSEKPFEAENSMSGFPDFLPDTAPSTPPGPPREDVFRG